MVRCLRLWEDCSKEVVQVFHVHLRLLTADISCQVWQNRRECAPENSLPFGESLAKHRSSKRKDLGSKTWAHVTQLERQHVSRSQCFQGMPPSEQGQAALGGLCAIPLCNGWLSCTFLLAVRQGPSATLNASALELTTRKTEKLLLQHYYFYWGIFA